MFKIAGILIKDRVRRMKKTIECHKILMFFAVVGLISCIYTTSLQDILFLKKYLIYVTWISMLYLGLKIMNPTQEAIIDYQLIELKLITRRQFKLLIGMKLYGVGTIIAIINYCILKEKTIYIFCILNCAVNIYVFFRSSYRVHLLDLVMIIYVCYCSWCESEVPISHPHHNAVGNCPKCRHQIQYKALGRAKNIETQKETAYLLQTCGNNVFVLREFQLQMLIVSSSYKKPVYSFFERRRILYDEELNTKEYYFGRHHWTKENQWIQGKLQVPLYPGYGGYMTYEKYNMGNIYGKSLYGIKNRTFRRTGFYEYAKTKKYLDPVSFFEMVKERPYLERLIKAGLYHLAEDIMDNKAQIYCKDSGNLGKALGIDGFRLKRLRTNNGGEIFLQWLLLEKTQNKLIHDDVILWMCREKLKPADLMFIMDRMAPLQIKNYLEKQAAESGESVKDLIKTWKDYLNMAIRVGVNVQDSVIYRARKLMQRHNEMIKEIEAKDLILRAGELEKKYPGLNRICRDLKKYEYADKEYQIVVPEKVDDILYEAKLMHHCVNNTETYYERMSQQESYILFLRKAEQPTEAYYTLEVEPDGTIRQTRTFYNQQNEDIELARDFLVKWQKQLKKKLAKEDYKLAVKSQSLRKKEIDELRSKGVRVNGVGYCNKLLAEILEEDLMEAGNRELEEQAA